MVLFNHSTRELTAKIVYYGPGLCGKTTNLRVLHEKLERGTAGRLLSLATAQDRTIYFDLLPVELGNIKGYTVRFQLCTVPGQVFYNETRKLVLRGVDGIVFVVDSQWSMLSHNLESFQNLRDNLREADLALESIPVVVQYNKRDLPGVLSIEALQESLNFQPYPYVEAVASAGRGVVETFRLISKLTFVDLLRRLQRGAGVEGVPDSRKHDPLEETAVQRRRSGSQPVIAAAPAATASAGFTAGGSLGAAPSGNPSGTIRAADAVVPKPPVISGEPFDDVPARAEQSWGRPQAPITAPAAERPHGPPPATEAPFETVVPAVGAAAWNFGRTDDVFDVEPAAPPPAIAEPDPFAAPPPPLPPIELPPPSLVLSKRAASAQVTISSDKITTEPIEPAATVAATEAAGAAEGADAAAEIAADAGSAVGPDLSEPADAIPPSDEEAVQPEPDAADGAGETAAAEPEEDVMGQPPPVPAAMLEAIAKLEAATADAHDQLSRLEERFAPVDTLEAVQATLDGLMLDAVKPGDLQALRESLDELAPRSELAPLAAMVEAQESLGGRVASLEVELAREREESARLQVQLEEARALRPELESLSRRLAETVDPVRHEVSELRHALAAQSERHDRALATGLEALRERLAGELRGEAQAGLQGVRAAQEALEGKSAARSELYGLRGVLEGETSGLRRQLDELRSAIQVEKERREAFPTVQAQIESLRGDLETRTKTIGEVIEVFHARLSEEATTARDFAAAEIRRLEERQAELIAKLSDLEGALARAASGTEEAQRKAEERVSSAEERTRRLLESIRKALEEVVS